MSKYLEKIAKFSPKKLLGLASGKRVAKAEGTWQKRLSTAIKGKGKNETANRKHSKADKALNLARKGQQKVRTGAGAVAASGATITAAAAYKKKNQD